MFKTYEETIEWIHSLLPHGIKPGTRRVTWMLEKLGHPERRLRSVHIAGTNGKGSTVSFLRHMMQEGGYSVGTFTSPYIVRFNERISVNGEGITDKDLIEAANRVKPLVDELAASELGQPTEFETITVMAMLYFAEVAVPDYVLFEVGLGGRLDSTNVIFPLVTVITNIGYDHMEILGDTIEEIAAEKAGIIKSGTPVITAVDKPEALHVIRDKSAERKAKLYVLGENFFASHDSSVLTGEHFSYRSLFAEMKDLSLGMKGRHQVENAAAALMAVDYLKQYFALILEEDEIRAGLRKARWPGRFEEVSSQPHVILDGAHNPEGVRSLVKTLRQYYPEKEIRVVFAALENKNIEEMIHPLEELTKHIILTSFSFDRSASAEELAKRSGLPEEILEPDWRQALESATKDGNENTVIVVTGSLYFVSEVRKLFPHGK
ncbi:MAG TPA: folylpolyglutamate synthase/dihydrofolate synthase family protein [Bacillales bacterium]